MADFEKLNRETREYNSRIRYGTSSKNVGYGTFEHWLGFYNNQTYKENNDQYSKHYS